MAMEINTQIINDIPVMQIEGRVSASGSYSFVSSIKTLSAHQSAKIILDLQKATFIDSAAVGSICAVHIERQKMGKTLEILVGPQQNNFIANLFETTGLKAVLNIIKAN